MGKLTSFNFDENLFEDFKKICDRENETMKSKFEEYMKDYLKKHGDGNPNFTLDQFDNPQFKAVPAVFRDSKTWENYLKTRNKQELKEFESQMNVLITAYNKASKQVF